MKKKVRVIAREIGIDLDELLVLMWEAGMDSISGEDDYLGRSEIKAVMAELGLPSLRDVRSPSVWCQLLGISDQNLERVLIKAGFPWRVGKKLIPHGAPWLLRGMLPQVDDSSMASDSVEPKSQRSAARLRIHEDAVPSIVGREWVTVGAVRDRIYHLSVDDILRIRRHLAAEFSKTEDPFFETGVVRTDLLESAAARPCTSLNGERKYPSVEMAAAALLHSMVLNHPFHDGNKRTGLVSMLAFLDANGLILTCTDGDVFKFVLKVAKHGFSKGAEVGRADVECLAASQWILENSRRIERGERPLKWIKLKRILRSHGCSFETAHVGNRLDIMRDVRSRRFLVKGRRLKVQVQCGGDGTEADKNCVAEVRRALELDEHHGVDSRVFYDADDLEVDDFIQIYRKILHQLSRL